MTAVRPFFLLLGRASVFWLGAFALFAGAMIVAGAADRGTPIDRMLNAPFIATVWFPAAAGWLAGLMIQEFQHTSFAHQLPGVRSRLRAGYVGTGLVVALVVAGVIALSGSTLWSLPLLFVVCLGAFCVGGALQDPLSVWVGWTNTILVLFVLAMSRDLARLAGEHPWIAAAVSLAVGAAGLRRLFARGVSGLARGRPAGAPVTSAAIRGPGSVPPATKHTAGRGGKALPRRSVPCGPPAWSC